MKIVKMLSQHRRDFRALFECENCGEQIERGGYDDRFYHDNVIPKMECENCGKSRNDLGIAMRTSRLTILGRYSPIKAKLSFAVLTLFA